MESSLKSKGEKLSKIVRKKMRRNYWKKTKPKKQNNKRIIYFLENKSLGEFIKKIKMSEIYQMKNLYEY